jgi:hypothetical protein
MPTFLRSIGVSEESWQEDDAEGSIRRIVKLIQHDLRSPLKCPIGSSKPFAARGPASENRISLSALEVVRPAVRGRLLDQRSSRPSVGRRAARTDAGCAHR